MNTMQLFFSFVFKGPVGPRGPQGLQGQQVSLFIIKSHTVKKKKIKRKKLFLWEMTAFG